MYRAENIAYAALTLIAVTIALYGTKSVRTAGRGTSYHGGVDPPQYLLHTGGDVSMETVGGGKSN